MSFYNRFSDLFATTEIELAHSLPILTADKEIVFFYEEKENQEHKRVIGKINYIAYKKIIDGKEFKICADEILPIEITDEIKGTVLNDELSVEEELQKEDYYINLYNQLFSKTDEKGVTEKELNKLLEELKNVLNSESLFKLYEFLFNYTFTELL